MGHRGVAGTTTGVAGPVSDASMGDIELPRGWRDRLEAIAGDRRDIRSVAVVVALAVIVSVAVWSRSAPALIAPSSVSPSPAVAAPQATTAALTGSIFVHVAGAVEEPGLYELPAGSRVADALAAAGGAAPKADVGLLNLAEVLTDAAKVDVPRRGSPASGSVAATPQVPGASPAPALVNINSADQVALESIPGVGPVTALAILQYRQEIGSFSSVEQLLEVSGIGPATLESVRPYVTI